MASPIPTMTPAQQTRARQLEESRQFLEALLSGQMPTGFAPTVQDWGRVLNLIGQAASQYGWEAVTPAIQRWVQPAIFGNLPVDLRNQALELLAERAVAMGANDPVLQQYLLAGGAGTAEDLLTRGSLLATLAPTMYTQPWFQEAYRRFVQQTLPGGTALGAALPSVQAVAAPYFTMQQLLGPEGYAAQGLPILQFPTSDVNMPRPWAELARNIGELQAQMAGFQIGPGGLVQETPRERIARILRGASDAFAYVAPAGGATFGVSPGLTVGIPGTEPQPISPIPLPTVTTTEQPEGQQERQSALRQFLQTIGQAGRQAWQFLTGTVPPPPGLNVEQVRQAFARPSDLVRELQLLQADPTLSAEDRVALQQLLFWAESLRRSGDRWPQP